jgi:hypothetical protein
LKVHRLWLAARDAGFNVGACQLSITLKNIMPLFSNPKSPEPVYLALRRKVSASKRHLSHTRFAARSSECRYLDENRGDRLEEKNLWCRGPDSNRQAVKRRIFFTPRLSTPRIPGGMPVRALDYAFTIAARFAAHTA